jgi:hypothetical protein
MIVDPDFFDHWKTRMVVDALGGDELAPLYIMRLWSHCQTRKGEVFDIPTSGIKAICKYAGEAKVLEDALVSADYLIREDKTVTIVGWLEKNASLVAAWSNGNLGGRPPKAKKETHGEPMENPRVTQGKPTDNPRQTHGEPIREDKSREEITPRKRGSVVDQPKDVLDTTWTDFLTHRKAKKAAVTETVVNQIRKEAEKAGIPLDDALQECCARGWLSFKADWHMPSIKTDKPMFAGLI